jgi:DNA-binding MarR family transcriptional regulator
MTTPASPPADSFAPQVPEKNYELRILQSLRRIIRAVDMHSHKLSSQYKITGPQLGCLIALKEEQPLTIAQLAKKVYLSPSTLVGIIDRLEEKDLVQRKRDPSDRRRVQIYVTTQGTDLIAAAPSLLQETLVSALKELPEPEQISITMALEKLVDLMEARHIGAAPMLETGSLSAEIPHE